MCPGKNSSLEKEKGWLGLTSTYKYKTIHTSVWKLPQGEVEMRWKGRGGVYSLQPKLSSSVPTVQGRFLQERLFYSHWSSQHPGAAHGMEAGQQWAGWKSLSLRGIHSVQKHVRGNGRGSGTGARSGQDKEVTKKNNRQDLQNDSSCPTERSPLGVEARDEPLSMLSEPELWCCCSEPALDVMVDEEVEEDRVFSLKSVMITVTFPTVMANCWAVLLSMFFSFGLWMEKDKNTPNKSLWSPKKNLYFLYTEMSQLGFHKSVN